MPGVRCGPRSLRVRCLLALVVAFAALSSVAVPALADVAIQTTVPVQTGAAIARYSVPTDRSKTIEVPVAGRLDLPSSGVGAVVLNVTALGSTADGFVTV